MTGLLEERIAVVTGGGSGIGRAIALGYAREGAQVAILDCNGDAAAETVQALLLLHEQQFQSIVGGDPESDRFDILIHMANERKHDAKYAYLRHLESHGCSTYYGIEQS